MKAFLAKDLKFLSRKSFGSKGVNGQVTIIGGSSLFHGAPILSAVAASRAVDMVFFASPEKPLEKVAAQIKSKLSSFIWVPWREVDQYIEKSDAVLIGPGLMRDEKISQEVTENLLKKYPNKKWVIDGGSLQVVKPDVFPQGSIITPNQKEFSLLFGSAEVVAMARKYKLIIAAKNLDGMIVSDAEESYEIPSNNIPLSGGGTGDVLAGLTAGLLAKNSPLLSAAAAGFLVQQASQSLYSQVGNNFNADDLAWEIGKVWKKEADDLK